MGKKSRRKGGGSNNKKKADRTEQQSQERGEQQPAQHQPSDAAQNLQRAPALSREYYVGDRVWIIPSDEERNPNSYRGVIHDIKEDHYLVITMQAIIDGTETSIQVTKEKIFPDFHALTLRFDIGDKVVALDNNGCWVAGTVERLWPVIVFAKMPQLPSSPKSAMIHYVIRSEFGQWLPIISDDDSSIKSRSTSFRFQVGGRVLFDPKKVQASDNAAVLLRRCSTWLSGVITATHVSREGVDYAAYECSFHVGKKSYSCLIIRDDDEHIAQVDAEPRTRLSDAIEQGCNRSHFQYLAMHFNINVSTFRDLVIAKAIEFASYQALLWLQHDCDVDVLHLKDEAGNNLLHMIAQSKHAALFIREAARMKDLLRDNLQYEDRKLLVLDHYDNNLILGLNESGEVWLQILMRRGNSKAVDAAFSPYHRFAWELMSEYDYDDTNLPQSLGTLIDESKDPLLKHIFDSFVAARKLRGQYTGLKCPNRNPVLDMIKGESAEHNAKVLSRFCLDWKYHICSQGQSAFAQVHSLLSIGHFELFRLLYEAEPRLFDGRNNSVLNEDRGQFIHPQLGDIVKRNAVVGSDIIYACVLGANSPAKLKKCNLGIYLNDIKSYFLFFDADKSPSLQSHLSTFCGAKTNNRGVGFMDVINFVAYFFERLRLITDDDNVDGRQKILDYLFLKLPNIQLDVILIAMKNRQCWVLRSMVEKGYLDLESQASANGFLVKNAQELIFLENGQIPPSMTTKCCLCFAAVQYDDLQTLQFLCDDTFGIPAELFAGWNLLHFSAYMGRIEIAGWLSTQTQPVWNSFASQCCGREPYRGAFAPHIAINRGHLDLCELLVQLEAKQQGILHEDRLPFFRLDQLDPYEDEKGHTLEFYARQSEHDFVQGMVTSKDIKKNKQLELEKSITSLFDIIDNEPIEHELVKNFITDSKCLDIKGMWIEFCSRSDEKSPMGYSFEDVVRKCCKNVDDELVMWLCFRLFKHSVTYDYYYFWGISTSEEGEVVPTDEIVSLAQDRGFGDLLILLRKKWFEHVSFENPALRHHILESALGRERAQEIRAASVHDDALVQIASVSVETIFDIFAKGGNEGELGELVNLHSSVVKTLMGAACNCELSLRSIDMELNLHQSPHLSYDDDHPLEKHLGFANKSRYDRYQLNVVLATEGYAELTRFCLNNIGGWTVEMELDSIRIASYFGHTEIVDMFVYPERSFSFLSGINDRRNAAILGAGESLRYSDLVAHVNNMHEIHTDPVQMEAIGVAKGAMTKSLLVAVLYGYARERTDHDSKTEFKMLRFIADNFGYTHDEMLYSMEYLLNISFKSRSESAKWIACIAELMSSVICAFGIKPATEMMIQICKTMASNCNMWRDEIDTNRDGPNKILSWFQNVADLGIDLRPFRIDLLRMHEETDFGKEFVELEQKQLRQWSQFDVVKQGGTLDEVQEAVNNGNLIISRRDRGGLHLIHISAAYDRVDLLKWLVTSKGMDLNLMDGEHRSALDVAKASKATDAMQWIVEYNAKRTILSSLKRNHYRAMKIRRRQKLDRAAALIQKIIRAYATRKIYNGVLLRRLEDSQRFLPIWGKFLDSYHDYGQDYVCSKTQSSWSDIREKLMDINVGLNDEFRQDTNERLSSALEKALQQVEEVGDIISEDVDCDEIFVEDDDANESLHAFHTDQWLSFQVTSHVVKFLQQGDKKYRSFFVRRMQQLARGERSRILQKALKGSKTLVYETYLEQKSGHRILWTEEGNNIVVWYIAKHKQVSRLMQLIDNSKSRSARQHVPDSLVSELQNEGLLPKNEPKEVLLDIFGNVPLKVYDVNFNTINEIKNDSWTPQLHLTEEERDIVEAEGTVLVLGRSGTGKTVTVTQRIEYDRQSRPGQDPTFTQLFVARSVRLCRYVEGTVSEDTRTSFCTYGRLISDVESCLPPGRHVKIFNPSQRMDFSRFKQEFHNLSAKSERVSALISWMVIRTFLKGSLEAFQSPNGLLPMDAFVKAEQLGKNRCRIPPELREHLYAEFLRYQAYLADKKLWDDCDRVRHLALRIKESMELDPDAFSQVQRSKVYVDEVQDYTQLELLLFFYLAGPNGLFLAGDPAQSVVEGTDFRFEEVRSVGHFVGSVIQKPKTVNINFRSHSGILNCAGGVLDLMFSHFPNSAKQLKKDFGLFQGSRPGALLGATVDQLNILLSDKLKGAIVLTHDESARHWRRMLNDYKVSIHHVLPFYSWTDFIHHVCVPIYLFLACLRNP